MTKIDKDVLVDLFNNNLLYEEIATVFNVYPQSVGKMARKLGLKRSYIERSRVYKSLPPSANWKNRKVICDICKKEFITKVPTAKYCAICRKEVKKLDYDIYLETKKIRTKLRQLVEENYEEALKLVNEMLILEGQKFTTFVTKGIIENY